MRHTQSGFTLIELFVSLSIVAILLATAIPSFQRYRTYTHDLAAMIDVRNISFGLQAAELGDESNSNFLVSMKGPVKLPAPLHQLSLSKGVQATIALWEFSFSFLNFQYDYTYR